MSNCRNIFAGPYSQNEPETLEIVGATVLTKPGLVVDAKGAAFVAGQQLMVVGTQLHAKPDHEPSAEVARLHYTRSGLLFNIRATAGLTFVKGDPIAINADGRAIAPVSAGDEVFFLDEDVTATTLDQLILVRVA